MGGPAERAVLLVERDGPARSEIERGLIQHGFDVVSTGWVAVARRTLAHAVFPLVVLGSELPDGSGLELLRDLRANRARRRVLLLGDSGDEEALAECRRLDADDYLCRPVDTAELALRAGRAFGLCPGMPEPTENAPMPSSTGHLAPTRSQKIRKLYELIELYAQAAPTPVLIQGETGVGKERVARTLHERSQHAGRPFVALNCATFDTPLFESELFGHERGSFTGAQQRKAGLLELADGGTLFLDEIAEMPLAAQAKLLRAIESRTFRRVGGTQEIESDFWLIAATNRQFPPLLASHRFRTDLYFRVATLLIEIPPLRERLCDLDSLVRDLCADLAGPDKPLDIDRELLDAFAAYDWPGNIRELRNVIERTLVLRRNPGLDLREHLGEGLGPNRCEPTAPGEAPESESAPPPLLTLKEVERDAVRRTLARCRGNKSATARALGVPRSTLKRMLRRHQFDS